MKKYLIILFSIFCATANAHPPSVRDGSWRWSINSGDEIEITLVVSGKVVCGTYNGLVGSKNSGFYFAGYQAKDGRIHVYFPNGYTGALDDIGEADIRQNGNVLKWVLTQDTKGENYVDDDKDLHSTRPDVESRTELKKECPAIAHEFGEIDKDNAHEAAAKMNPP
jgi:hypothetical protein